LTRSVAFLSRLLEAGVDVRFAGLAQIEGGRPISPPLYRRATGGWRQDPKSHRRQPERTPHPDSAGRRPMVGGAGQSRAGVVVGDGTRAGLVRCQKPFRRLSGGNDEDWYDRPCGGLCSIVKLDSPRETSPSSPPPPPPRNDHGIIHRSFGSELGWRRRRQVAPRWPRRKQKAGRITRCDLARRRRGAAAYADCTESQMMAMFGWTDPKMPAHYIAQAN